MSQVFLNLISNAIKFRHPDRPPLVHVSASSDVDHTVYVADNGIGFDMRHKDRIFEMFSSLAESPEGQGIGLTICKSVIERHGGDISVQSVPGEGTTFSFSLSPHRYPPHPESISLEEVPYASAPLE